MASGYLYMKQTDSLDITIPPKLVDNKVMAVKRAMPPENSDANDDSPTKQPPAPPVSEVEQSFQKTLKY